MSASGLKHNRFLFWLPGILAVVLFIPLFAFRRWGSLDFWWWMSLNVLIVVSVSFLADKSYAAVLKKDLRTEPKKKIFLGLLSAIFLYGVFFAGNYISRKVFPAAGHGINQVYSFKEGASVLRIALLMTLVIGPGEELFWRGYIQRKWQDRFGLFPGFLSAVLFYALVHLSSGNLMLVLAAGVCGLFWGLLYNRYKSVLLLMISHTLWDLMVFLAFTLEG
jgi:membrane protease YdiL (CAAX protease family)